MAIQENAVGANIEYTVLDANGDPKDISTATIKKLIFKKPNGVTLEKTADFTNTGSDGKLKITSIDGDLQPYGIFQVQALLTIGTFNSRTKTDTFPVERNV